MWCVQICNKKKKLNFIKRETRIYKHKNYISIPTSACACYFHSSPLLSPLIKFVKPQSALNDQAKKSSTLSNQSNSRTKAKKIEIRGHWDPYFLLVCVSVLICMYVWIYCHNIQRLYIPWINIITIIMQGFKFQKLLFSEVKFNIFTKFSTRFSQRWSYKTIIFACKNINYLNFHTLWMYTQTV